MISPLPFYTDILKQNQNLWYAYGHVYTYNYEIGFVPPFQLVIPDDIEPAGVLPNDWFDVIQINNEEYQFVIDVKSTMISEHGLVAEKFDDGYIIVKNKSTSILDTDWNPIPLPGISSDEPMEGNHYLKIVANNVAYCSEIWSWKKDVDQGQRNIQIRYSHEEDISYKNGHIDYQDFQHIINISSTVGKPSYPIREDSEKRIGFDFVLFQVSKKRFQFEFWCAEYVLDAIRIIRLHDNITIETNGIEFDVIDILFTPQFENSGHLARVVCEFETSNSVILSGSSIGDTEPDNPDPPGPPPPFVRGDYNDDYSNDYFNL